MELPFKLENHVEERIAKDKTWIEGVMWGVPRKGHPEGKVILHIKEVLDNVDKLRIDEKTRQKLRVIALIHDSLKYKSDTDKSIHAENKHAVFAKRFAEKYTKDQDILEIIELHDEAYFSWK
ncbi:HD domain-containing protein, partial [archaeon]|nr:HD domain-containing protein [archaeon]